MYTPGKTNVEPKKGWFIKEFLFAREHFHLPIVVLKGLHSCQLIQLAAKWTLNEDAFTIEHVDIPLLCYFTRGYSTLSLHDVCHMIFFRQGIITTNHFPIQPTPKKKQQKPHGFIDLTSVASNDLRNSGARAPNLVLACCWSPPQDFLPR